MAALDFENNSFAPIIKYMRNWSDDDIHAYCLKKDWKLMPLVTIQDVTVSEVKNGRNAYQIANVVYTAANGENKEKKVMSFANPAVFSVVSKASSGSQFNVGYKEGDQYYNWVSIEAVGDSVAPKATPMSPGAKQVVSTYETADERKIKQLYIIRQSSISNALEFYKLNSPKGGISRDDVLNTAQEFVDFVYGTEENLAASHAGIQGISEG